MAWLRGLSASMCHAHANVTARLVVGLSMCGLRGDDVVRLKRLKPPWINATAS